MSAFLHGVEVIEIDTGTRPIQTVRSSVIGLIGTAPDAYADKFPLNTPVLIAGRRSDAAGLGASGTLPDAIDGIFDQIGAMVVMIRVAEDATDAAATISNVVGGIDAVTGARTGLQAFLDAQSTLALTPRILIAPGFSQNLPVATDMVGIAERLKAVMVIDGPNSTDADAIAYRANFNSDRVYLVDPWVRVWDTITNAEVVRPASDRVAGVIAKSDHERGFWVSPSNRAINGILGTARPIDFVLGDATCRANYLNENEVATIINSDGYILWGNRSCASDPKWAFLKRRRISDMIGESILRGHMWAVDRNATTTYFEDVTEGVNEYLRRLQAQGAIVNGKCWPDPDLNTPESQEAGRVWFNYDWVDPATAERITFRAHINNDYLEDVLPKAA